MYEDTIGVKMLVYQNQLPYHKILHKLIKRTWLKVYSFSFHQLSNQMSHASAITTDVQVGRLGVEVVEHAASVLQEEMPICHTGL